MKENKYLRHCDKDLLKRQKEMITELKLIDEELKRRENVKLKRELELMKKQLINLMNSNRLLLALGEEEYEGEYEELINPNFNIYIENNKIIMQIY